VKASARTALELSGLVTRTSQTCGSAEPSFCALNVTMIVAGSTTCTPRTCCGGPCPPSKLTAAPVWKPDPMIVMVTVVLACALFGLTLWMVTCAVVVFVLVAAGEGEGAVTVGEAGTAVVGGKDVGVSGVGDAGRGVGEPGIVV